MNRRRFFLSLTVGVFFLILVVWLFLYNRDESPGQAPPPQDLERAKNEILKTEQSDTLDAIRSQAPTISPQAQEQSRQLDQLRQTQEQTKP